MIEARAAADGARYELVKKIVEVGRGRGRGWDCCEVLGGRGYTGSGVGGGMG
jgi:hypothetical protein